MQYRQSDRKLYFHELSTTSQKYFIPYIEKYKEITHGINVLEIGCGDGGNLLPFSKKGCNTLGVDLAECRISDAKKDFLPHEGLFLSLFLRGKCRLEDINKFVEESSFLIFLGFICYLKFYTKAFSNLGEKKKIQLRNYLASKRQNVLLSFLRN